MTLLFILYIIYQYLSIKVILFKYVIDNKRKCLKLVKIRQEREPLKKGRDKYFFIYIFLLLGT